MSASQNHSPTIGASMVDFLHRASLSPESPERSDNSKNESDTNNDMADHGAPPPTHSLLAAVMESPEQRPTPTILRGPRLSGRSSLLMDMAQSLASSEDYSKACRGNCFSIGTECDCVAVAVLRPATERSEEDRFPLPLTRIFDYDDTNTKQNTLDAQLESLEQSTSPSPPIWDASALRRVRVHHVASFRDLIEYLLNLHALQPSQRPYRGILIDDVDVLARRTIPIDDNHQPSSMDLMNLSQILALLADSIHQLRREGATSLCVFVTMEASVPFNVERLFSTWFPVTMHVSPSENIQWNKSSLSTAGGFEEDDGHGMTLLNSWTLDRVDENDHSTVVKAESRLAFARVKSRARARIVWKETGQRLTPG